MLMKRRKLPTRAEVHPVVGGCALRNLRSPDLVIQEQKKIDIWPLLI